MKILITGGTGFVGKRVVRILKDQGHHLILLTRNPSQYKNDSRSTYYQWSPLSGPPKKEYFEGVEAVINLMGESIANGRWTASQKKRILDSRVQGTLNLVKGIEDHCENKLKAFVSASAVGIYPVNRPDSLDENFEKASNFLADVCKQWEQSALTLKNTAKIFIPRIGVVLGKEGGMIQKLMPIFKLGGGGPIGAGKQLMSWIHVQDLANLIVSGLTNDKLEGPFNAVAPQVVSNAEFTKAFGSAVNRPAFFPVPPFMLKLVFGEMSTLMLDSQNVSCEKLTQAGFNFLYPSITSAMNEIAGKQTVAKVIEAES